MGWSGQEDGMDVMKEIIQKEIQSISSLEERVIFKNLMEGVFLSLYDTNREMYEGLERRIKEELDYDKNRYYVKTGIVEREFFDASHHLLAPMDESDLAEKLYDMKEILRAVEEEGAFRLMKVMLRCDFLEQQKLLALEEMIEGIRSGRQYLYTLLLEFEPKDLLEGRLTVPFIKNFYDVEQNEAGMILLVSNARKVVFNVSDAPCTKVKMPLNKWIEQTKEAMKDMHIYIKPGKKAVVGNMEYFCYTAPTSRGRLFNIVFRLKKGGRIYAGNLNCPEEEQKGMGLLLEAMVHVIEEMNR